MPDIIAWMFIMSFALEKMPGIVHSKIAAGSTPAIPNIENYGGVRFVMGAPANHPSHGWPWIQIQTHGDDWGSPISRNNQMKYEIIIWWIPGGLPGRFGSDRRFPYSIINPICSIEYLPTFGPLLGYILLNISAPWSIWVIFQQQYGSPGNAERVCVFWSRSCGYNDAMGYSMGGRTKNMICALIHLQFIDLWQWPLNAWENPKDQWSFNGKTIYKAIDGVFFIAMFFQDIRGWLMVKMSRVQSWWSIIFMDPLH